MLRPLPSGLSPCLPSDSGTRLAAIPFSVRRLASQQLPQRLGLTFRFPAAPLGFRFRFWLLGLGFILSDASRSLQTCCPQRTSVYYHTRSCLSTPFFQIFSTFLFSSFLCSAYQPIVCFLKRVFYFNQLIRSMNKPGKKARNRCRMHLLQSGFMFLRGGYM